MGRLDLAALRVRETAIAQATCGKSSRRPCWADAMADIPPAPVLVRNRPRQHPVTRQRVKTVPGKSKPQVVFESPPNRKQPPKKASRMFKPLEIRYEEDELRKEFFRDHPWELARPRVVLESDGNDHRRHDWKKLRQPGRKVDGESVVQHQLYLLNNVPNMTKAGAYDIARKEFYRLRQKEDVERKIAQEEALATGAYFGPSLIEQGMKLEDQEYERWKAWSEQESALFSQRTDATLGVVRESAAAGPEPAGAREEGERGGK